jgi:hypothetical protein
VFAVGRGRGELRLAWIAELWGVLLIALVCAVTGDAGSPFALLYLFAIGHAAAFQPQGRFVLVALGSLFAFLAPSAYSHVSATFAAVALIGVTSALFAAGVIHVAVTRLRDQRRGMEFLTAASAQLDASLDPTETLRRIAEFAVPELAELCVIDVLEGRESIGGTVAAAVDPSLAAGVERSPAALRLDPGGIDPVHKVLRGGAPFVVNDPNVLKQPVGSDERQRSMQAGGYRAIAVLPMVARGRTQGAISYVHLRPGARFGPGQLVVLEDFTARAAMAFDNARLYAERDHVAHTLQRSLVPPALSVIPGLELASCFRPMGAGNEVGGDFYDAFVANDGSWLVVGDVCGKGAEAAAVTAFLRHTIVAYARESTSPARVLLDVNRAMLDQGFDDRFATAVLARLGAPQPERHVTIATAGHPLPLIMRAGGPSGELGPYGTLLGVYPDPVIQETSTVLRPGDSLALYTDGLLEAHAPDRTLTVKQMIEWLEEAAPRSAQDTIDALLTLVDPGGGVRDDIAIVTARVRDEQAIA